MKASRNASNFALGAGSAHRNVWMALIVTSGLSLSLLFACVTPFAAFATLAALKLGRREAIAVLSLVWAGNQAVGYGVLGYPWTWDSAAWGLAIGISTAVAMLAAMALSTTRPAPLAVSLPFMSAFAAFEFGLYIAGLVLPGSADAFAASVVWGVFLVNTVAFLGLLLAYQLLRLVGFMTPATRFPGIPSTT